MNAQKGASKVAIYTAASPLRHPSRLIVDMFSALWASRELAWQLAARDISAKYREAALGILWIFIIPLANTAAWLFIQASGAVKIQAVGISYPVFVITGTLLWSIFMDAVSAPLQQSQAARQMLAKINFPPEALILSGIYQTLFSAGIKVVFLMVALYWLSVPFSVLIFLVPVAVASLVLIGTVIGLAMTPIGLLFSDVGRGLPMVLQFLMYLSPVVYAVPMTGWAGRLMTFNPLTTVIEFSRAVLVGADLGNMVVFITINGVALVLLVVAWMIYRATLPILVERMSA